VSLGYTLSRAGRLYHARQIFCFRGDNGVTIWLAADEQAFATDNAALDQILATWSWA
jgi:hypothetical protein